MIANMLCYLSSLKVVWFYCPSCVTESLQNKVGKENTEKEEKEKPHQKREKHTSPDVVKNRIDEGRKINRDKNKSPYFIVLTLYHMHKNLQYPGQSCSISHSIFNVIGSLSNQIRDVLPVL